MEQDVDAMRKQELMDYAKWIGVPTRKNGTKNYRPCADVKADCKAWLRSTQAEPQTSDGRPPTQAPGGHAEGPGTASSNLAQAAPLASGREAPRAAGLSADDLETMEGPRTASPNLAQAAGGAPTQAPGGHAEGPGTASSNLAQAAPLASGREAPRAAGLSADDLETMSRDRLRKCAVSIGVSSRAARYTDGELREACKRGLQGQSKLSRFFPASQWGRAGGAAPVSDSALGVAPRQPLIGAHRRWGSSVKDARKRDRRRAGCNVLEKARDKARGDARHKARDKARDKLHVRSVRREVRKKEQRSSDFVKRADDYSMRKKHRSAQGNAEPVVPKSARSDRAGVLGREGTWKRAAAQSARLCQHDGPSHLPPSYAALDQEPQRRLTSQMCGCLAEVQWATCVVCWRAWYDLPAGYEFSYTQKGLRSPQAPWFDPSSSVITRARKKGAVNQWRVEAAGSEEEAQLYVAANYSAEECSAIAHRLQCPERRRVLTICSDCYTYVGDDYVLPAPEGEMRMCDFVVDPVWCSPVPSGVAIAHERFEGAPPPGPASEEACSRVLGFSVGEFADPVAALTDHEEMVLGLVHPLVQVYTIPRTGQLAYVGHICNFRQKVAKFLRSLPVMPADMPVVHVRPRKYKGKQPGRALFKVNVAKLKAAFLWLKANNPYYADVEWRDDAADAWADGDVEVGTTREADDDSSHAPPVTPTCFVRWMEHAAAEAAAGDFGYAIGKRVRELVLEGDSDDEEPVSDSPAGSGVWARVRRLVAEVFGKSIFRMATALPQDILVVALAARGVLDLGLPQAGEPFDALRALRTLDTNDCPEDLHVLRAELDAVMLEEYDEDPEVVHAGATASAQAGDDVGLREGVLDALADAAKEVIGGASDAPGSASADAPGSGSALPDAAPLADDALQFPGRRVKYPRVDPPDVEDQPGQAIREDTPGYIARAFPKLFPHGVGDYHCDRGGLRRTLRFEEWGRYVMLWHDGRFMRHTRFRYWLLDTMLRVMVPGVQRTFFRTRQACADYTLESLMDKGKRRELVQQMSTVTNLIPGSIGERRKMRQELEAMVHQVEAETADLGMNGGAGRIPSGFCTLTCSVYKWAQLHETLLKAYPSGAAENPECREHYTQWKLLPPGSARETAMKKTYYQLAVRDPGAVAWYCAVKLEMATALTAALLTEQLQSDGVPGLGDAQEKMQAELGSRMGVDISVEDIPDLRHFGQVDDWYVSYEWSPGGIIHAHMAFWVVGAPRIDKIAVPREQARGSGGVEIETPLPGQSVVPQAEAAGRLAAFWDRAYTEYNVAKAMCPALGAAAPGAPCSASAAAPGAPGSASADFAGAVGVRQGLGAVGEKQVRSPESISHEAHAHCLLGTLDAGGAESGRCWAELVEILAGCSRTPREVLQKELIEPGSASSDARQAKARLRFVAALAEWVNMHDLHKPYAVGPPAKDQPCAHVDDEHSTMERVSCKKLFPRKLVPPGEEEIAEDPGRRDLYRLWLARNCHFLNNFIPTVMLAMLSNMDFQATLSKDAVIDYMTKYMTKSGQGALIKVMEHSFSLCVEKARENNQGSGSAVLRWFNLQSISEVKSQLECMHLIFGAPRFMCTREFRDLYLRAETRRPKTTARLRSENDPSARIVEKSQAEHYVTRWEWKLPSDTALSKRHPLTAEPFWSFVLRKAGVPVSDSATLSGSKGVVEHNWQLFLELLGWWEVKRCFNRSGDSVALKPVADIVVIHPVGRFTQASTDAQWRDACVWTLLAHCNHGETCKDTFRDADDLATFSDDSVAELMERFATAAPAERLGARLAPCPPHIAKAWHLGVARRKRAEEKKHSTSRVASAIAPVKYIFVEEAADWRQKMWEAMAAPDQEEATEAWRKAELRPVSDSAEVRDEAAVLEDDENEKIREAMVAFIRKDLKWTHRELHDALLVARVAVPPTPSMQNYISALYAQYGSADAGFLPQNFQSHAKPKLQSILRILSRTGLKLGGKISDKKGVLAERLARWLNRVLAAGREVPGGASGGEDDSADDLGERPRPQQPLLIEHAACVGEIPQNARVTPEQAESALGRSLTTEMDTDYADAVDADTKEEEEALAGHKVNPGGFDYACISWQPCAPDFVSADTVGWESTRPARQLARSDFNCSKESVGAKLQGARANLAAEFRCEMASAQSDFSAAARTLDPTQKLLAEVLVEWAEKRVAWRQALPASTGGASSGPLLRLAVLSTAGTGKTHTAKIAINEVRRIFKSYDSVLTLAFSGVAAANLGSGASTIDSIFHTNRAAAAEDLVGDRLDELVNLLEGVELLVIDEVSTCGAGALEIISRRMQQVARVLWRRRFRSEPPEDMVPFGGVGVLLMGDFAQLPPVLATSLLAGMPLVEGGGAAARAVALAGRQTFAKFDDVVRLRRIHRQKGVDAFKESTMRLRDAAITREDYELWKTHELDVLQESGPGSASHCSWEGSENLLREAVVLVPENAAAGKVNGKQLAARAPLHGTAGSSSAAGVVVRIEARHNNPRGKHKPADDFRQVRRALHLCVGARVMLTQNRIWGVPTVPLGLMNGARGVAVAILYVSTDGERTDGSVLAGTGHPTSMLGAFPRGEHLCPVPDFVVVHFPDYKGPACFDDLPKTWVPIPCAEAQHKTLQWVTRASLPLRLAWALTIHKSQGITTHEGSIVSFDGCSGRAPVAKLGLAFVAWTRATKWGRMAFHKLPPFADFLAARLTREFSARAEFEQQADAMFLKLLERRGTSHEALLAEHERHLQAQTLAQEGRDPTGAEIADLRAMLSAVGVAPVSDSVTRYCEQQSGRKAGGLWSFVASFRAEKKSAPAKGGRRRAGTKAADAVPADEDAAAQTMADMGFKQVDITRALEQTSFHFGRALLLLLNGLDANRTSERFRRHARKTVKAADVEALGEGQVLTQYSQRARSEFNFDPRVWDLGQAAGSTTGACFWLCLAAGLAECGPHVLAQALPGPCAVRQSVGELVAQGVQGSVDAGVCHAPLGIVAEALRTRFCGTDSAVLLRGDVRARIYMAFAGLAVDGPARTEAMYAGWVQRLATREYADELVALCVAMELGIRITIIPFTRRVARGMWAVSSYGPEGADHTIHMGNNDVHYVYLSRRGT